MPIFTKEQYALIVRSLQKDIKLKTEFDIKLSAVRESLSKALGYKSSNGLLSELPVTICFPNIGLELHKELSISHGLDYRTSLSTFPFPKGFVLNQNELETILKFTHPQDVDETSIALLTPLVMPNGLDYIINGNIDLLPLGNGKWQSSDKKNLHAIRTILGKSNVEYLSKQPTIDSNSLQSAYLSLLPAFAQSIEKQNILGKVKLKILECLGSNALIDVSTSSTFYITPDNDGISLLDILYLPLTRAKDNQLIQNFILDFIPTEFINDLLIRQNFESSEFYFNNVWMKLLGDNVKEQGRANYDSISDKIWSYESKLLITTLFLNLCEQNNWLSEKISDVILPTFNANTNTINYSFELSDKKHHEVISRGPAIVELKPYSRGIIQEYIDDFCSSVEETDEIESIIEDIESEYNETEIEYNEFDDEDLEFVKRSKLSSLPIPMSLPCISNVKSTIDGKAIISGTFFDFSGTSGYFDNFYTYFDFFTDDFCYLSNAARHHDDLKQDMVLVLGSFSYTNLDDFIEALKQLCETLEVEVLVLDNFFIKSHFPAYPHKSFKGLEAQLQNAHSDLDNAIASVVDVSEYKLGNQTSDPLFNSGVY